MYAPFIMEYLGYSLEWRTGISTMFLHREESLFWILILMVRNDIYHAQPTNYWYCLSAALFSGNVVLLYILNTTLLQVVSCDNDITGKYCRVEPIG